MSQYQSAICRVGQFDPDGNLFEVVGAGFLVSDRHIFTCAHVVNAALGNVKEQADYPSDEISVELLQEKAGEWLKCKVAYWLPMNPKQPKEDIAILELLQPLDSEWAITLPKQDSPPRSRCEAYGFPDGMPKGVWSYQLLQDFQLSPRSWGQLSKRTDQTASDYSILPGFSGTLLWDEDHQQVAGMVVAAARSRQPINTAFVIPASVLLEVQRSFALFELLAPYREKYSKQLRAAYLACKPENKQMESPSSDLKRLLAQVEDVEIDSPGFVWDFVAHLIKNKTIVEEQLKISLTSWASRNCDDFAAVLQEAEKQVHLNAERQQSSKARSAVLVVLKPASQQAAGRFFLQVFSVIDCDAYDHKEESDNLMLNVAASDVECIDESQAALAPAERHYPLDAIPQLLAQCLEAVDQELANPCVEIFLPLEQLETPVDIWELRDELLDDTEYLGNQYQVVLRSYDRFEKKIKYQEWMNRWEDLDRSSSSKANDRFCPSDGANLGQLKVEMTKPDYVGLCLSKPPKGKQTFAPVLRNGIPAAVWIRQDLCHCDCADELETLLSCILQDVPQAVREQWQAAYASGVDHQAPLEQTQLGHHLALLWDNPNLLPPKPQPLVMPS